MAASISEISKQVAHVTSSVRAEVTTFLSAMSDDETANKQSHERVPAKA